MAVQLQTSVIITKTLRLRYHNRFGKDDYINNAKRLITDIFTKEKNKSKIDFDNGTFSFIADDPVQREDFRAYIEEKGYITDTSFNNNIIKIKAVALLDCIHENESELFKQLSDEIDKNSEVEKTIKDKIKQAKWQELKTELKSQALSLVGSIIAGVIV